jgi:hypothetical protein
MPRPNPNRTIGGERVLARRIAEEREARDWTLEMLSRRMEAVGCPLHTSAIFKIETGDKKTGKLRRITVDELVAFASVFEISMEDLVTPGALRDRRLRRLVDAWWDARQVLAAAKQEVLIAETHLRAHLVKNPDRAATLEHQLAARAAESEEDEDTAQGVGAELSLLLARARTSLAPHEQVGLDQRGTGRI